MADGRRKQIANIWGLAKRCELDESELRSIVEGVTGQRSISALSTAQRNKVILALKDHLYTVKPELKPKKPSDDGTNRMVWKIRQLEKELGWDDNPARLISFMNKYYHVERLEWLTPQQAWRLIESLKAMLKKVEG